MSFLRWKEAPIDCGARVVMASVSRARVVAQAANGFLLPMLNTFGCWHCRAAALADLADAIRRLVEEMPVEAQDSFRRQNEALVQMFNTQRAEAKAAAQEALEGHG